MLFFGYIALGNVDGSNNFTELAVTGYSRQSWSFSRVGFAQTGTAELDLAAAQSSDPLCGPLFLPLADTDDAIHDNDNGHLGLAINAVLPLMRKYTRTP